MSPVLGPGTPGGVTAWAANTPYSLGQLVTYRGDVYRAASQHTTATFDRTKWRPVAQAMLDLTGGVAWFDWGHSYLVGAVAGNSQGYNHLFKKQQMVYGGANYAVAGTSAAWTSGVINKNWTGGYSGFHLLHPLRNDTSIGDTTNWPGQAAFSTDTYQACVDLLRCGATIVKDTAGGCTYSGTWTHVTGDTTWSQGGTYSKTATQNDYVDVVVSGDSHVIVLQSRPNLTPSTPVGTLGASYSIKQGATVLATGSTSYGSVSSTADVGIKTVLITGLGSGSHTLRITKTDAGTGELRFDAIRAIDSTPCTILCALEQDVDPATTAATTLMRAIVTAAVSPFTDGSVVPVDPVAYWDRTTMVYNDGLHPNDKGHHAYLQALRDAVSALDWRDGQNVM